MFGSAQRKRLSPDDLVEFQAVFLACDKTEQHLEHTILDPHEQSPIGVRIVGLAAIGVRKPILFLLPFCHPVNLRQRLLSVMHHQ